MRRVTRRHFLFIRKIKCFYDTSNLSNSKLNQQKKQLLSITHCTQEDYTKIK